MKHLAFCIIMCTGLLACNNKKKNAVPATASPTEVAETRSDLDKRLEDLQTLTPFTPEEMRPLLPVELDGDSARQVEVTSNLGTGLVGATYTLSDTSKIEVTVFDCGGVAGAGIYTMQFVNQIGNQFEQPQRYKKLIDFKGGKAIEQVDHEKQTCSLSYIDNDRFLVIMDGNNVDISEVKDKAKALKLK